MCPDILTPFRSQNICACFRLTTFESNVVGNGGCPSTALPSMIPPTSPIVIRLFSRNESCRGCRMTVAVALSTEMDSVIDGHADK